MLPGLRLTKKYGEKLWRIGKDHLRDLDALPKEHFNKLLKTLVSKFEESGASSENLVDFSSVASIQMLFTKSCPVRM